MSEDKKAGREATADVKEYAVTLVSGLVCWCFSLLKSSQTVTTFSNYRLQWSRRSRTLLVIMALDGCGLVCKYILIIFNCIFAVLGFVFLGLGLWLRFSDNTRPIFQIQELNSSTFVLGVTVMIGLGSVMLIVVMFGDHGACSERKCSLQVFSVLVAILAGAEIIIGVLVYSRSDQVGERIAEFYVSLYGVYVATGDPAIAVTLTFVHKMLHCCGVTGIPLIDIAKQTCPKPDGFFQNFVMPNCPGTIATAFDSKAPLVMGMFVGTGALLITALVCSIILLRDIKRSQQDVNVYYSKVF